MKLLSSILAVYLFIAASSCSKPPRLLQPLPRDAVILAFGNSLTYGTGVAQEQSYPSILEQLSGFTTLNEGIPGEISANGLKRLPALLDEVKPDLLILIHGGNDILRNLSLEQTRENLSQMISLAKQQGVQVILLGVPTFNVFSLNSHPLYQQLALQHEIPINTDILPDILADDSLKSDRIHPNAAGYHLMAEAIIKLLQQQGAINL